MRGEVIQSRKFWTNKRGKRVPDDQWSNGPSYWETVVLTLGLRGGLTLESLRLP